MLGAFGSTALGRSALGAVMAVAALMATLPVTGVAGDGGKVRAACWNKGPPFEAGASPVLRHKPHRCNFYERGNQPDFPFVAAKHLRWKSWGKRKAKATGVALASAVGYAPIKIRLSKPKRNCDGRRVFSRGSFRYWGLRTGGDVPLYVC